MQLSINRRKINKCYFNYGEDLIHILAIVTQFTMHVIKRAYNKSRYRRIHALCCRSYKYLNMQNNAMHIV